MGIIIYAGIHAVSAQVLLVPEKTMNSDMLNSNFICFCPVNLIPPIFFLDFLPKYQMYIILKNKHFVSLITGNQHPLLPPAPLSSIIPEKPPVATLESFFIIHHQVSKKHYIIMSFTIIQFYLSIDFIL